MAQSFDEIYRIGYKRSERIIIHHERLKYLKKKGAQRSGRRNLDQAVAGSIAGQGT